MWPKKTIIYVFYCKYLEDVHATVAILTFLIALSWTMYVFTFDVGLGQRLQLRILHSSKKMWSPRSELTFTAASASWELTLPYQFSKQGIIVCTISRTWFYSTSPSSLFDSVASITNFNVVHWKAKTWFSLFLTKKNFRICKFVKLSF